MASISRKIEDSNEPDEEDEETFGHYTEFVEEFGFTPRIVDVRLPKHIRSSHG